LKAQGTRLFIALIIASLSVTSCGQPLSPPATQSPSSTVRPVSTASPAPAPTAAAVPAPGQVAPTPIQAAQTDVRFNKSGYTTLGDWDSDVVAGPNRWQPGAAVRVQANLRVWDAHLAALNGSGIKADGFVLLVTAERTFDADGWLRLPSDERMSTLLTPTGLAIEGGVQGAVTNRFGYRFRTPVDELVTVPLTATTKLDAYRMASFMVQTKLPATLPPGIYRLRLDYGVTVKGRYYNLNGEAFAKRGFPKGRVTESEAYSPLIRADGAHVSGRVVDAATIRPRIPWVLLANYNSNGYRGVIASEDEPRFALSGRLLIPDEVILPLYDENNPKVTLSYSLEPQFPADTIDVSSNIQWDYTKGELSIEVTGPDGKTVDLGTAPFVGKTGQWPTTKKPAFTAWKPARYGLYTVKAAGWTQDIWGNRYEGGGTYRFWIAKRMTMATATFQGQAYPVGGRYGRDMAFAPAVAADVSVTATLYANSSPANARTITYSGKASPGGVFGAAQGMQPLVFDAPGEYAAQVLATYTDQEGHLWVSSMHHAGVIYPEDSSIVARGKKLTDSKGKLVDRGDTNFEGWVDVANDVNHLAHINYPYLPGDVLLIASDHQGANKIEPVLTYELKQNPAPYDPGLQGIGLTNVRLQTSNGYSPHLFPEYITDWAYFYAGAPRPGFMSRFLVAEDGTRAPYWPTSPNAFGGQVNASSNGDLPGDIYRLIGGVVLRRLGQSPQYAGYMANAFVLPKDSKDNRVIAAGSEDLLGSTGEKARFWLVGTRPGMLYETGAAFAPAVQIDPMLPVTVTFTLFYPDGRAVTAQGMGDSFGSFVGKDRWTLDLPGVYRYTLEATWEGFKGYMPGLPKSGGEFYVIEKTPPAGAKGILLDLPTQSSFPPASGLVITGTSSASEIRYAAVIPGAAILQGTVPVEKGRFRFFFDPAAINKTTPTYDTVNLVSGKPEIGDVVHLTFFSEEKTPGGAVYHSFVRLILRGNKVLYVR
jgi:hypothetical protein